MFLSTWTVDFVGLILRSLHFVVKSQSFPPPGTLCPARTPLPVSGPSRSPLDSTPCPDLDLGPASCLTVSSPDSSDLTNHSPTLLDLVISLFGSFAADFECDPTSSRTEAVGAPFRTLDPPRSRVVTLPVGSRSPPHSGSVCDGTRVECKGFGSGSLGPTKVHGLDTEACLECL